MENLTPKNEREEIGRRGEEIACEYLKNRSYKIIARNYRQPWGEIDIICQHKNKTLTFIEVKTMRQNNNLEPEDNFSKAKLKKFQRMAILYAGENKYDIEKRGWQLDLIAITFQKRLTENYKDYTIRHWENVSDVW